jgi:hypothetical protein
VAKAMANPIRLNMGTRETICLILPGFFHIKTGKRTAARKGRYVAAKNNGLECSMAIFPRLDVMLYIKATIIIYREPRSRSMARNGSNIPFLVVFTFSKYAPKAVTTIPMIP